MGLDQEFITRADSIRKRIMNLGEFGIGNKTSNYNSKIIIDKCSICKCNADEVHHIEEQHLANNNMIEYFHKNSLFNLVQLCQFHIF